MQLSCSNLSNAFPKDGTNSKQYGRHNAQSPQEKITPITDSLLYFFLIRYPETVQFDGNVFILLVHPALTFVTYVFIVFISIQRSFIRNLWESSFSLIHCKNHGKDYWIGARIKLSLGSSIVNFLFLLYFQYLVQKRYVFQLGFGRWSSLIFT